MNKQFKMIWSYKAVILLFLYAVLLMQGCSKSTNGGELLLGDKTRLTVSVLGIVEGGVIGNKGQSLATKAAVKPGLAIASEIVSHIEGFDSRFSVVEDEFKGDRMVSISNNDKEGTATTVRAESMSNGIYYHLIVYKVSDNSVVASQVMRSGDAVQIIVDGGVQYKWVAFSYNTAVAADLPAVADPAAPVVSMGQNKDFLYASGTITVNSLNTPLGIVFSHKLARIGVELNTMGMFADLNTATVVNENQLKTGNFNLLTGTVTGALTTIATASTSTFTRPTAYGFDDRSTAYFYTADPASLPNLNIKLTGLSIKLDAYAVSQSQATRNFGVLSTVYSSPNFVPVLGQSKTFRIDLLESPITTTSNNGGAVVTRWARANLYYVSGDHNPYRFHHLNQKTQDNNTFFAFGAIHPQTYATEGAEADPCALVYPTGVWRQATRSDYQGLVGRSILEGGFISAKTPTRVAGQYLEYAAVGTASPYPTNAVRFNLNGSAVGVSLVVGLIDLNFGFYGQNAEVWTSTSLISLPPLVSLGAIHYEATGTTHGLVTDILDLQLLGAVNVVKSNFMNVRCVRN
ncbi:fimbrillin family protein [Sphingobacterium sp. SRCM116780]|uniref:fimbrillin family protein n=1 Tax=Sphingobacterium sp. SRCM116780 TaxID=2907623 RepID=UPI001F2B4066|nr:fimbrillin family protein [Sphingobacterium sp. SRCM116780]UIR55975.1 fimbrillin family protein [Sphingobacterium sp. SRCM116780]